MSKGHPYLTLIRPNRWFFLWLTLSIYICGVLLVPKMEETDSFLRRLYSKASYSLFKNPTLSSKYLVIHCPRIPVPETEDSFHMVVDLLRELELMEPEVVIFDVDPGVSRSSPLYPWISTGDLKEKFIFVEPEKNELQSLLFLRKTEYSLTNAVFAVNQRENLEIESLIPINGLPTVGEKAKSILEQSLLSYKSRKMRFFFKDVDIHRYSLEKFRRKFLGSESLKGKIILIRTGSGSSSFERAFLTPLGIMKADTLAFNEVETWIDDQEKTFPLSVEFIILLVYMLLIWGIFSYTRIFIALILIFFLGQAPLFIGAWYYHWGIIFHYSWYLLFPALQILVAGLVGLYRINRVHDSLKELDQLKKNLKHQNKELVALNRLKDWAKVTSGIHHEINNPLHNILNSLRMINSGGQLDEDNKEMLSVALQEIERLKRLTSHLKKFNRPDEGKEDLLDIREILSFTVKVMKPSLAAQNISIIMEQPDEEARVVGEQDKLQQVFLNLLLNAADAVENDGKIFVTVKLGNGLVRIFFKDEGGGISQEVRSEIFKAFFSTKGEKGSGMGLYVSYEIVNQMGGDIIISEPVDGAEFIVELPEASF